MSVNCFLDALNSVSDNLCRWSWLDLTTLQGLRQEVTVNGLANVRLSGEDQRCKDYFVSAKLLQSGCGQ
jgi:hypothetical protein